MHNVRTVERALNILLFVARQNRPHGLTEISRELKLDKATVLRLISTLERRDLIRQHPDTRRYEVGPAVALLSSAGQHALRRLCRPYLEGLWRETKETVCLVCPHGGFDRAHVEVLPAQHELRLVPDVGSVWPIYVGASGRVMLAFMPFDHVERVIRESKLARRNAAHVPTRSEVLADLARIRRRGYLISVGETIAGGAAVAGPVFDGSGQVVGAISIRGPHTRFNQALMRRYAPLVRSASLALSRELGFATNPLSPEWHAQLGWSPASLVSLKN